MEDKLNWCTGRYIFEYGVSKPPYKTSDPCPQRDYKDGALWCNVSGQEVIDMTKCPSGFWGKNKKGFPTTTEGR